MGLPAQALQVASPRDLCRQVIQSRDAVVCIRAGNPWRHPVARRLAEEEGAIIPVVCEPPDEWLIYSLVHEKTVTENITASGGNPGLLAGKN